jgi:ribosomal protein L14E/L6E/L27E
VYTRFIEIGRVALVNYGPDAGKLCTIIDILDQNRVLVDGPANITGVHRQLLTMKRLTLTDFKVVIGRQARYVANANSTHQSCWNYFRARRHSAPAGRSHTSMALRIYLRRLWVGFWLVGFHTRVRVLPSCIDWNVRSQATLTAAWKVADVAAKWAATAWAKKLAAQKTRAALTDLDRFKLMIARKQVCFCCSRKFHYRWSVWPCAIYTPCSVVLHAWDHLPIVAIPDSFNIPNVFLSRVSQKAKILSKAVGALKKSASKK